MNKLICTLLLLAGALAAADDRPRFLVYREDTLSSAATVVTVQQPTSDAAKVYYESASLYCSVACTFTLEIGGTAASTTAITPVALVIGSGATAKSAAFHTSNVGVGTVLGKFVLAAGEKLALDLSLIRTYGATATRNLSLRSNAISGDAKVQIVWMENQ